LERSKHTPQLARLLQREVPGERPPEPPRGMDERHTRLAPYVTSTEISRASVGLRSERGPILLAVMLSMSLVAIDSTILATAVPSIVADLGGFTQFPWLFSVYLLTQAVTVPIYAKLA